MSADTIIRLLTNNEIAEARRRGGLPGPCECDRWADIESRRGGGEPRREFRLPVVRQWGIAPGVRPRRVRTKPEVLAISWLILLLIAVGVVAAVIAP